MLEIPLYSEERDTLKINLHLNDNSKNDIPSRVGAIFPFAIMHPTLLVPAGIGTFYFNCRDRNFGNFIYTNSQA